MTSIQKPTAAQTLLTRVQGGAPVDKALATNAIEVAATLDMPAARALIKDILTTSKSLTPQAKEALEAFVAASTTKPEVPLLGGLLAKWVGRSPPMREGPSDWALVNNAAAAAGRILNQSPKDVLANALEKIDPLLAQTVRLDSKYSVGLAGMAKQFPELKAALTSFSAAQEPATALMTALLSTLTPPQPLKEQLAALKGGAVLDRNAAFSLMRAAQQEGAPTSTLQQALSSSKNSTEAGAAFLRGWIDSPSKSVEGRYYDAYVAEFHARSPLGAFDKALDGLDPKLAKLGHSVLLMTGQYPHLGAAFSAISDLVKNRSIESWSAPAHDIVAKALQQQA